MGTFFSLEQGPFAVTSVGLAPDIAITASAVTGVEGNSTGAVTVASFTDGSDASPASDFTASINWGDGTSSAGTVTGGSGVQYTVTASHTYAEEGSHTTAITVTDTNLPTINTATADGDRERQRCAPYRHGATAVDPRRDDEHAVQRGCGELHRWQSDRSPQRLHRHDQLG